MKYLVLFVVALGAYFYYQKSNLYSHENMVKIVLNKQSEICSNGEMLRHQRTTTDACHQMFTKNLGSCVAAMGTKYSGSKFSSKAEADKTGSELVNCLTVRK